VPTGSRILRSCVPPTRTVHTFSMSQKTKSKWGQRTPIAKEWLNIRTGKVDLCVLASHVATENPKPVYDTPPAWIIGRVPESIDVSETRSLTTRLYISGLAKRAYWDYIEGKTPSQIEHTRRSRESE